MGTSSGDIGVDESVFRLGAIQIKYPGRCTLSRRNCTDECYAMRREFITECTYFIKVKSFCELPTISFPRACIKVEEGFSFISQVGRY